jgi:hypothetical protein
VIASVALFVALGAGAFAATHVRKNSVGSKAIRDGSVKSPDIHNHTIKGHDIGGGQVKTSNLKNGSVTTAKSSFIRYSALTSSNATTSPSPTDLGGPNVTVTVPAGAVLEVFAQAQISSVGGGPNAAGRVDLVAPPLVTTPQSIMSSPSNTFQNRYTAPGSLDSDGVLNRARGGWITMVPAPGTYTFSLRYEANGGGTATFQNRLLLVRVTR